MQHSEFLLPGELHAATRHLHHDVDHHPLLAPLVRAGLTRQDYRYILQSLHGLHLAIDHALEASCLRLGTTEPLFPSPRLRWLAEDLRYLGVALPPSRAPAGIVCPEHHSLPELVGALYVVEGSTLGGQVIARLVSASLGLGPATGVRHFHGHGDATHARWASFLTAAEQACATAEQRATACAAATRMFALILDALEHFHGARPALESHPA